MDTVLEKDQNTPETVGSRLRLWRKSMRMKLLDVKEMIGVSQGSLSDIENNKSLPSADTIAKLYQFTNLNIVWLLTGKGSMVRSENGHHAIEQGETQLVEETMEIYGEDQKLRELVEKLIRIYRRGTSEKKAHLVGFLNGADPG